MLVSAGCAHQTPPEAHLPAKTLLHYPSSAHILSGFRIDSNNHDAAVALAEIGLHLESMKAYDSGLWPSYGDDVSLEGSQLLAVPAVNYIVSEAERHRITIINEEHHVSTHRFFTRQLLRGLYDKGYRYFGAETLNAADSLLEQRGYPTMTSGYYTKEPQYGNLIREALRIGYKVFAYEATGGQNGRPREIIQAKKIAAILKKDSSAKILIHCGYGHLIESQVQDWEYAMAGWLQKFTGIDPLTVDQVELSEHSAEEYENPYYREMNYSDFVVLIAGTGKIPLRFRQDGSASDIFVYHPRTRLVYGRPHWLFSQYDPVFVTDSVELKFPVVVKAYLANEDSSAVPADVIEIKSPGDSTALALERGRRYRIEISNHTQPDQIFFTGRRSILTN